MFLEITGRFCNFQKPENLLQVTKTITGPKPKCKCGLGLSAISWETSVPWEGSEGRSKHVGWNEKEERWGRHPSGLAHPREPQKQKQGKPEARDTSTNRWTTCLPHRTCLRGSGTSVAILITSPTFERPTLLPSKQSCLALYPGPVIFWTNYLLSCGWMQHVYNKSFPLWS